MSRREVHGPDSGTERSGTQIYREIVPISARIGTTLKSSFSGFLLIGFGGLGVFLPVTLYLTLPAGLVLAVYVLATPVVLPLRLPKVARRRDRNHPSPEDRSPRMAAGIWFLGHDWKTNQQLWLTNEDMRQHVVVPGTTGAGKTRALLSQMANPLIHGSGFIFVDGKADNGLYADVQALARQFGREDDVLALNFLVASGNKHTNTFNPFSFCNADVLRELLVSQIEENPGGSGKSGVFLAGAVALLGSLAPVLVWVRDNRNIPIEIERIRFATELRCVATLVAKKKFLIRVPNASEPKEIDVADMPEDYFYPLKAYLGETGAFDIDLPWNQQKTDEPSRQHSFVLLHFRQTFTQLAVSLGHIFKCESGDIDMRDVVLNRRILVVNLPTLENSGETTAALGKIVVASLRNMMAQTLGADLEGNYDEIVANKPSMAPTPFPVVLDEVGYYAGPGMDKMLAMGRGLGFSFLLGFQEVAGLRARLGDTVYSLLGNANLQILMRLQEGGQTREYVEKTAGDTFVTQAGSFERSSSGGYQETRHAELRQTSRVNWGDLRGQIEGEAVVLFGKYRVYTKLFYVDPKPSGELRLNRPLALPPPNRARLRARQDRLVHAVKRIRDWDAAPAAKTMPATTPALVAVFNGVRQAMDDGPVTPESLAAYALQAIERLPDPPGPPSAEVLRALTLDDEIPPGTPQTGVPAHEDETFPNVAQSSDAGHKQESSASDRKADKAGHMTPAAVAASVNEVTRSTQADLMETLMCRGVQPITAEEFREVTEALTQALAEVRQVPIK